jgi:hypothetical protein
MSVVDKLEIVALKSQLLHDGAKAGNLRPSDLNMKISEIIQKLTEVMQDSRTDL